MYAFESDDCTGDGQMVGEPGGWGSWCYPLTGKWSVKIVPENFEHCNGRLSDVTL